MTEQVVDAVNWGKGFAWVAVLLIWTFAIMPGVVHYYLIADSYVGKILIGIGVSIGLVFLILIAFAIGGGIKE